VDASDQAKLTFHMPKEKLHECIISAIACSRIARCDAMAFVDLLELIKMAYSGSRLSKRVINIYAYMQLSIMNVHIFSGF